MKISHHRDPHHLALAMVKAIREFLIELETDDPGDAEDVFPARLNEAQAATERLHEALEALRTT